MFPPNALSPLINAKKEHINRDWQISLNHIYREANFAADFMANISSSLPFGFHRYHNPLEDLNLWVRYGMYGRHKYYYIMSIIDINLNCLLFILGFMKK